MVYVTGDTHGFPQRFAGFDDDKWTKDDYLIICGDFGFLFLDNESEKKYLDFLEATRPYTICFCDGNHENFPAIYKYPQENWHGGQVHRIRKNIVHMMRGQIFEIENKTFFTFGGAYSIDKANRKEGYSWWPEEQPTDEEYEIGLENLEKCGYKVDYIITHTAPCELVERMIALQPWGVRFGFEIDTHDFTLMSYLGSILHKAQFSHWYFGHWHFDTKIDEKSTALFEEVYRVNTDK